MPASLFAQDSVFKLMRCANLPDTIQMHGSAVVGDRLYVMGGEGAGGWLNKVYSAGIANDGTLSQWREEAELPELRQYIMNSVEVVNDRIYIIGGSVAKTRGDTDAQVKLQRNVIWTTVKSDGTLQPWKTTADWPGLAISCVSTCSYEGHLYVVGGRSPNANIRSTVLMCDFAPDGAPINWRETRQFPITIWFEGAEIQNDRIYVWGGLPTADTDPVNEKVYSAGLSKDGSIEAWRDEGVPLSQPVYSSAFCGINDYLVSLGGRYRNGHPTSVIWFTRLNNAKLNPWHMLKTDMEATVYHSAAVDITRGIVYVTGGQKRTVPGREQARKLLSTVQAFRISQPQEAVIAEKTQQAVTKSSTGSTGYIPLQEALVKGAAEKKNVVVFFYSPNVPACKRVLEDILQTPEFRNMTASSIMAEADISKNNEAAYKYGIFKVPSLAVINSDGTLSKRIMRVNSLEDLQPLFR